MRFVGHLQPLVSWLALGLVGAAPQAPPQREQPPAPSPVVRVSLTLVQVDAVVTDKAGHHVTDLTAADFEIFEDGRAQEITQCSYVALPRIELPAPRPAPGPVAVPPPPPTPLRRDQVRRTLALVVDDLGLSFRSTIEVRDALKKFVDEQMEPGDLVAIIRTGGGIGALQQFTADKQQLYAAIERVRFNAAQSRMGIDAFTPVGEGKNVIDSGSGPRGARAPIGKSVDDLRESMLANATIGSLNFVISGMRQLPGRKGVVLFSDGLRLFQDVFEERMVAERGSRGAGGSGLTSEPQRVSSQVDPRVSSTIGRLIDFANQASVVLYTVDTRGLYSRTLTAVDDVNLPGQTAAQLAANMTRQLDTRRRSSLDNEAGLEYVAKETGGFMLRNQNDLSRSISRVLDDQRGYYLIGYAPDASTFRGRRPAFHEIALKVKRPGLVVRSRAGFYGTIPEQGPDEPAAAQRALAQVLASPFASGDIRLELATLFAHDQDRGYLVRSLIHMDTSDLNLTRQEDGAWGTQVELLAVTFGDNGQVVDQLGRLQEIRVQPDSLEQAHREGLTYRLDVPVAKPGAYHLRVALRDTSDGRVGTVNQLVQVPDLGKKRLVLSEIVVGALAAAGAAGPDARTEATAAQRQFRAGDALTYSYVVYNAQLDRATGRPQLAARMRLFRDGEPLTVGEPRPLDTKGPRGSRTVTGGGAFQLGPEMPPGDYVLQVIVSDTLSRSDDAVVARAIDFEVR